MRAVRLTAALVVSMTALTLTGCSVNPKPATPSVLDAVTVSGSTGSRPSIDMHTPLVTDSTECREVIPGDGEKITDGELVTMDLSIYNGSTGKLVNRTSYDGSDPLAVLYADTLLPGLHKGLECASEGSRVLMAIPPADAFKEQGNLDWGITADDTLVIVADITKVYLARANGDVQLSQDGMPMVVLAPNGQPGITVPKTAAPTHERLSVLKKGSGTVVESGDRVTLHYTGAVWSTGNVFDSSWAKRKPVQFVVGDGTNDQGEVVQGFSDAIIGQTVGSQVLAVIPPELGYGSQAAGAIPPNSTLVFVIDILGVN
ncbi:MAG TPA: FKBP-type peptidyl-prolyl cis-trans isomerase [Microbacteriaceae bacterium]|nr:FKBP-type peptidyl-prolyl cis-trans isomerase [Microbacteriaceae bacterium]